MGGSGGGSSNFSRPSQPDTTAPPSKSPKGGSGGSSGGTPDPCDSIAFNAVLQSPKSAVVSKLKIGDILDIALSPDQYSINALASSGQIAGSIIPNNHKQMIDCLKKGKTFSAEVVSIQGGAIAVKVKAE